MERPMTYWKTENSVAPQFTLQTPTPYLDIAALIAIGATPFFLLLWLLPLPLVLPAYGIVSFVIACAAALYAHRSGINRSTPGVTTWDVVVLFTLNWIAIGVITGPKHIVELLETLAIGGP
jgi:hypothetical protein